MTTWPEATLGDVADLLVGFAFKSSNFTDDPDGTRLLRGVNIGQGSLDWKRCAYWPVSVHWDSRYELRADDVVLAMDRPWIEAGLKRARIRGEDLPALLVQRVTRLRGTAAVLTSFIHHLLATETFSRYLQSIVTGATVPHISQSQIAAYQFRLPPLAQQERICSLLDALDDLIENSRRRIELLEQMAQAIYREWFVRFRYPGHEDVPLVDSPLGPIPKGWEVTPVLAVAGTGRNAVTGGPFGSKLGRKDYVDAGVPVLRGANLRVGGGFDETDLVFVSEEKAAELRGSLATRGDIIVTQRGTLGQVGLIPPLSRFDRYLLSQSQMKITVDGGQATAEFIYAQFRTSETTERFIAQAMSSGVPHVNLALLREFEILVPPIATQAAFTEAVAPVSAEVLNLSEQRRVLKSIRDLLLPQLVTGQLDVSNLDLDALVDSVA